MVSTVAQAQGKDSRQLYLHAASVCLMNFCGKFVVVL